MRSLVVLVALSLAACALAVPEIGSRRQTLAARFAEQRLGVDVQTQAKLHPAVATAAANTIIASVPRLNNWMDQNGITHGQKVAQDNGQGGKEVKAVAMELNDLIFQSGTAATLLGCRATALNDIDAWSRRPMMHKGKHLLRIEQMNGVKANAWYKGDGADPGKEDQAHDLRQTNGFVEIAAGNELDIWTVFANYFGHGKESEIRKRVDAGKLLKVHLAGHDFNMFTCSDMISMKYGQIKTYKRQSKGQNKFVNDAGDIHCMCHDAPQCKKEELTDEATQICKGKWNEISAHMAGGNVYAQFIAAQVNDHKPAQEVIDYVKTRWPSV